MAKLHRFLWKSQKNLETLKEKVIVRVPDLGASNELHHSETEHDAMDVDDSDLGGDNAKTFTGVIYKLSNVPSWTPDDATEALANEVYERTEYRELSDYTEQFRKEEVKLSQGKHRTSTKTRPLVVTGQPGIGL